MRRDRSGDAWIVLAAAVGVAIGVGFALWLCSVVGVLG